MTVSEDRRTAMKIYYKTLRDEKLKEVTTFQKGAWIDFQKARPEDLEVVAKLTGLAIADVKDALDEFELPRIERQEGNILVFIRIPLNRENGIATITFTIILARDYLITISPQENHIVNCLLEERSALLNTTQKSKLLIQILLRIAHEYTHQIKTVRNKVRQQKKQIKRLTDKDIIDLVNSEDILNQFLSSLVPAKNVIEAILSGKYIHLYEEDEDLFEDLLINIKQSVDLCTVNLKNIINIRDAYQTIFTNRLNKTMKFLTAVTIILTIPTIVASVYGMNVRLPIAKSPLAFFIIISATFIISLLVTVVFYLKRWF